ncbi:MAG: hypothetical protein MI799_14720 [Desulfobacterales bacterium]|nr:hypothetical protein [Desulfobacterales bacterium]
MKQIVAFIAGLLLWLPPALGAAVIKPKPFVISGPPVAESLVFAVMADQGLSGESVEFITWQSPDQARAMIAAGKTQGSVVTTSAAAIFFNKGIKATVAGVFSSPLWIVSARPVSQGPVRGTLLFPFGPGEMPEIVFNIVMAKRLPHLETRHTGGALEAVNLLLMGRADHALLAEPAASLAAARSQKMPGPELTKHLDLGTLWENRFNGRPLCVSAFAVFGGAVDKPEQVAAIIKGYGLALDWIKTHPRETRAIAKKAAPALAGSGIPLAGTPMLTSPKAFDAARLFLEKIYDLDPGAVGNALPGPELFRVYP